MRVAAFTVASTSASAVTRRASRRAPRRLDWYDLSVIALVLASVAAAALKFLGQ